MYHGRISQQVSRPTQVLVDLGQIVRNYHAIQQHTGTHVMAIIKADAYGHGIVEVATRLQQENVAYFGVAYLEEALLLRESGIQTPILVLGGIVGAQIPLYIEHNITMTASSIDKLMAIEEFAKQYYAMQTDNKPKVHLKIDTGMERIGVHEYSAKGFLEKAKACQYVEIEGVYSHFANADSVNLSHATLQLERFHMVLTMATEMALSFRYRHIANSGAVLQLPESTLDMVRVGILLYGVYPSSSLAKTIDVRPALLWKSQVVFFKVVLPHRPVGYGSTWQSDQMTRVVTIPVGYGDGYHRHMMGQAEVLIRGKRYPVIGSICMDQIMVNIGWDEVYNGEEVVLLGSQGKEEITAHELALWSGSISYEMLTSINLRVSRVYI